MNPTLLRTRLAQALLNGAGLATLVGCAATTNSGRNDDETASAANSEVNAGAPNAGGSETDSGAHPEGSGAVGTGGVGGRSDGGVAALAAIPKRQCMGEHQEGPGEYGQCCPQVACREPGDDGTCLPADHRELTRLPEYPLGSGLCECSPVPLEGPFAPGADAAAAGCCYVIWSIGCEGRPLRRTDRSWVLAPVVRRADWGPRPRGDAGRA